MYNIIPIILILISLTVIVAVIGRKFPALANLDVENIPAEKEAKFKERIISNRLKRNYLKVKNRVVKILGPAAKVADSFFKFIYKKLIELKDNYKREEIIAGMDVAFRVRELFEEAEAFEKKGELGEAEKSYIDIIGLDNTNITAFKALGKIYFAKKELEEAKQTFEYILKLKGDDDEVYNELGHIAEERGDLDEAKVDYEKAIDLNSQRSSVFLDLALVSRAANNMEEAVENMKKALRIEPNNPRYLDTMLQMSIMVKDRVLALDAYERLKETNPENQKLEEFKAKIDEL